MKSPNFPRFSELHPAERAAFDKFLRGQTCPLIETENGFEPGFYAWDYSRFRNGRISDTLPETPPVFGRSGLRIAWLSDLHLCKSDFPDLIELLTKWKPDTALITGDIVERGLGRGISELMREIEKTGVQPIFVLGNHDLYGWSFADMDEFRANYSGPGTLLDRVAPIHLGAGVYLAGNSGWGGGILQEKFSPIRDQQEILEYRVAHPNRHLQIAKERAERLSGECPLDSIPPEAKHLVFACHPPLLKKASRYREQQTDRLLRPHFVWPSMTERLKNLRKDRPELGITVLSGHTHTRAFASEAGIHHVVAGAEYYEPRISAIFYPDFFLAPERRRATELRRAFTYHACPAHPCLEELERNRPR